LIVKVISASFKTTILFLRLITACSSFSFLLDFGETVLAMPFPSRLWLHFKTWQVSNVCTSVTTYYISTIWANKTIFVPFSLSLWIIIIRLLFWWLHNLSSSTRTFFGLRFFFLYSNWYLWFIFFIRITFRWRFRRVKILYKFTSASLPSVTELNWFLLFLDASLFWFFRSFFSLSNCKLFRCLFQNLHTQIKIVKVILDIRNIRYPSFFEFLIRPKLK